MGNELHPSQVALLKHFSYEHLPQHLAYVSRLFHDLAHNLASQVVDGQLANDAEMTTTLRKLLEAKDCAVRAALGAR